jgi:hypothetical protein
MSDTTIEIKSEESEKVQELEIIYFQVTDIWKRFCEEHTRLFNLTCDEYEALLGNDLNLLEAKINEKQKTINTITKLEEMRSEIIIKLNNNQVGQDPEKKIESINDLLVVMVEFEKGKDQNHLFRFNKLLIDIIQKIQEQSRKNQLYMNKAMKNISEIKSEILGEKSFKTYTQSGSTKLGT